MGTATSAITQPPPAIGAEPEVPTFLIKEEPIDPLQMDIDEDDIEYEPDRLNDQLAVSTSLSLIVLAKRPPMVEQRKHRTIRSE